MAKKKKNKKNFTGNWLTSPTRALRVSENFDLATLDRDSAPGWGGDKAQAEEFMAERGKLLSELQERYFANAKFGDERKVLVVLQGLDTAGKGGIARHVLGMVDPQGVQLASFGVPTKEEREHHFLWRIKKQLPRAGKIGLFDRSHYEDVLVQRVEKIVKEDVWRKRYDEINKWEKSLVDDGFTIIKCALMVSHKEQGMRLAERLVRPDKHWKYGTGDIDVRGKWFQYQDAYQDVFRYTSTDYAPWYVIPADKKWYSRLAITELLVQTLIDLEQDWPTPEWSYTEERERLIATMAAEDIAAAETVLTEKLDEANAERKGYLAAVEATNKVGDLDAGHRIDPSLAPEA